MAEKERNRTLYISHGGGPLPLLGDPGHLEMVRQLEHIVSRISRPSAILLISAHWEQPAPTITSSPWPALLYDYTGFPKAAYAIEYPAPGSPDLAQEVFDVLYSGGHGPVLDNERGFDHGMFVPLTIMYPDADIPCVQLSLTSGLDPVQHIQIGTALSEISCQNLLIIGSGFSFHNMRAFFSRASVEDQEKNDAFEAWLIDTCTNTQLTERDRQQRLVNWQQAPHARYCHPREEHLLPLHVCYGLNSCPSSDFFQLKILGKSASFYLWSK